MEGTTSVMQVRDVVTRRIAGETLIVPVKNGIGDLESIYTLNEVGTAIWQTIRERMSVNQIVEAVLNEFGGRRERVLNDVVEFLHSLETAGLIHTVTDPKEEP